MSRIYPVITLYQPWATWIMRGWKTIETRTHDRFKCLENRFILIHAGQTTDGSDLTTKNPYLSHEQILYNPEEMVNGFILGSAFVSSSKELSAGHSSRSLIDCENTKRYGLFLENVTKFNDPIPCKGNMGIWYYDLDLKQKVKA